VALAFDAVGPSSAGAISTGATTLTFAHTITGASTVLIAGIAVDPSGSDAALTCACTYNSVAMTSLDKWHSGGATQSAGYLQVFGIIAAAGGPFNVVATVSGGTPANIEGGSLSFTGAGQTLGAAFGTPAHNDSNSASVTTSTCNLPSNTSGNIIAGFTTSGTGITSATSPSTSRFLKSNTGTGAAGSCAGATSPSTGSSVTMAWTQLSDFFAEILVEVLAAASGANPVAGLASGTGAAQPVTMASNVMTSGPRYATATSDLGGVYGAWATPQYATGGP
jgi:hypothetical protein